MKEPQIVNKGGCWRLDSRLHHRASTWDSDIPSQRWGALGFRTFRTFRQPLNQQQPRS
jgi:hypothetical protein